MAAAPGHSGDRPARSELSLAMSGLSPRDLGVAGADRVAAANLRSVAGWVAASGLSAVQLDATAPGLRPRELDRSARRDLASLLRRSELACSGLDLGIPSDHFVDPQHADRAITATTEALRFVADLAALHDAEPVVCVTLPAEAGERREAAVAAVSSSAQSVGAVLADFGRGSDGDARVGVAIDPAAGIMSDRDPAALVLAAGGRLAHARLTDADQASRCPVGDGRLDTAAYAAALAALGFTRAPIIDVRGLRDARAGIAAAMQRWGSLLS